jgi:hypothetical protein
MAQLQSTCVIGTLSISASNANAQQSIMIGGGCNNAEFNNQCNIIAIGENTALSGSGALDPSTIIITQEGTNFTTLCYSYYAFNEEITLGKPVVISGGGGSGATFGGRVQRYNYSGPGDAGDIQAICIGSLGSGYTSTATGTVCDPCTVFETCEIFTIEPFVNENSINIGHNAGCRAQGQNTIRIGSCAAKGNLTNGFCYQKNSIAIGANTMLSGSYDNSIAIGHNTLTGCNTCTNSFRCITDTTVIGSNSIPNAISTIRWTTIVGANNFPTASCSNCNTVIGANNGTCLTSLSSLNTIIGYCNATVTGTNKNANSSNTIIGAFNMCCSFFSANNVVIGYGNMRFGCLNSGNNNIAIGCQNLEYLTTGDYNIGLGYYNGRCNTTGIGNIYLGVLAGCKNCTGGRSIFIGCIAGCGMSNQSDSIFIGAQTGIYGNSTQGGHVAMGTNALRNTCAGYHNTAIGYGALCVGGQASTSCAINGGCNIAIGPYAGQCIKGESNNNIYIGHQSGPTVFGAETYKFYLGQGSGNHLMCGCLNSSGRTLCVNGTLSKTAGSFAISHPNPTKTQACELWHSFVESPTAGDNLYRFKVEVEKGQATIDLPDYYKHLNENDQIWVNAKNHFGRAYGVVNKEQTTLTVFADTDGIYNILLIGTRKDKDAVNAWKGTERLKEN